MRFLVYYVQHCRSAVCMRAVTIVSVCLSVCLSHSCSVLKPLHESTNFSRILSFICHAGRRDCQNSDRVALLGNIRPNKKS